MPLTPVANTTISVSHPGWQVGGVQGGRAYGVSDEYGIMAQEDSAHTHDLHATILHQLGLDHERLTFRHAGRDFRLTDVHGNVLHDVLG